MPLFNRNKDLSNFILRGMNDARMIDIDYDVAWEKEIKEYTESARKSLAAN